MNRPTERALWTAVIETLRTTVHPHVTEPYAALQTQRLIGLALYARDRGDDPTDTRTAAITELIGEDNPTSVLIDEADPRRLELRALLMSHLDGDLDVEQPLLEHFRQRSTNDDA